MDKRELIVSVIGLVVVSAIATLAFDFYLSSSTLAEFANLALCN